MTLNIKIFSKSLTIDTHYARTPNSFPVNISGASQNISIENLGGTNTFSKNVEKISIVSSPDSSNNPQHLKDNNLSIYINSSNMTQYASVVNDYNGYNWISGNGEDLLSEMGGAGNTTYYTISTLKNLSTDSADTTASTLENTQTFDFPLLTSFSSSEYSKNVEKQQIIAQKSISVSNYASNSTSIIINDIHSVDLSKFIHGKTSIVSQTNKGAVSRTQANAKNIEFFIVNQADIAYFDLDGVIRLKQVTPFNDPIPPSDSTTGTGDTGSGGTGGTPTTTGPIQSWSS